MLVIIVGGKNLIVSSESIANYIYIFSFGLIFKNDGKWFAHDQRLKTSTLPAKEWNYHFS
jgi:hypothetical protein